jgi:hypothetical protein
MMFSNYHGWIVHSLLRIERAALESLGSETQLVTSDNLDELAVPLTMRNDSHYSDHERNGSNMEEGMSMNGGVGSSSSSSSSSRLLYCPKNPFLRKVFLALTMAIIVSILATFYYIHFRLSEENLTAMLPMWILEWINNPLILSFPFAAPMHRALGFFNPHTTRNECWGRCELLVHDKGTRMIINLATFCLVCYMTGDVGYFSQTIAPGISFVLLYGAVLLVEMLIWYGALLMLMLSMRAILIRLFMVENEVNEAVERYVAPSTMYSSMSQSEVPPAVGSGGTNNNEDASAQGSQAMRWLEAYRSIRHDIHEISENFGPRMLAALFFLILEVTASITVTWEEMKDEFSGYDLFCLLASYGSNITMIIMAFFTMAFPVTRCSHHIGPKLSMLATKRSDNAQYQQLATTFLLAPVRIHVGNFEVSPEYANGITAWFAALFLLVFGLTMPGME